jgi:3-deoxy-D-manno-octulosonate 8-phosphate phosphatase (KDO 8-P phosphatase)
MDNFKENLIKIKAFVFDVDGVFSDNVLLASNGELLRYMNVKDGYAVKLAGKLGFHVGIISGGNSESVRIRFEQLGIQDVYLASPDKMTDFKDFCSKHNIEAKEVLYMGDDIPDYEVMSIVGIAASPADAVPEIHSVSHYISHKKAGDGCVRDVIEQVLKAHGKWFNSPKQNN